MEVKRPWQSKSMVLNGVLGLLSAAALFMPGAESLAAWINGHAAEVGMAWGVLNIVLRAVTKDKIGLHD